MSKHERKLDKKSPASHEIKDNGTLDNSDLEKVTGGVTFTYGGFILEYSQQKTAGESTSAPQKK